MDDHVAALERWGQLAFDIGLKDIPVLDGGFCDSSPAHSAQAVASFPSAEYLLDPASHPVDWLVPFFGLTQRFLFVAALHAGRDDARYTALCSNSISEVVAPVARIDTVWGTLGAAQPAGKDLDGIIGQGIGARKTAEAKERGDTSASRRAEKRIESAVYRFAQNYPRTDLLGKASS